MENSKIINRVPAVLFSYWVIKIASTTLGETGADHFSKTLHVGYSSTSLIFLGLFVVSLFWKLKVKRYTPILYWSVFTTTSIAGTAMSDYMDRTLEMGYAWGSLFLVSLLSVILLAWYFVEKSLSVEKIYTTRAEVFYWMAFLVSNTLGTAVGDYLADDLELGFANGALIIGGLLVFLVFLFYTTKLSRILLFWLAFVLTRPFGATFGDFLARPFKDGGINLGTAGSSLVFLGMLMALLIKEHSSHKMLLLEEVD